MHSLLEQMFSEEYNQQIEGIYDQAFAAEQALRDTLSPEQITLLLATIDSYTLAYHTVCKKCYSAALKRGARLARILT